MADRLEALMCAAVSDWQAGKCVPYSVEYIETKARERRIDVTWPSHQDLADLEWTTLLTAGMTDLLDRATAQYGGTWPLTSVSRAIAQRLERVRRLGPQWCPGEAIAGPSLLNILMLGDGKAASEETRRFTARD